jgi:protein involved in polysaccharide export with SLBB domain
VYQIADQPSLLKLITLAGGFTTDRGSTAFIIREIKKPSRPRVVGGSESVASTTEKDTVANDESEIEPRYELHQANINSLLRGNFNQDTLIEPGDIVNIPPTDVFFVAGEVTTPGSFPLKEGTTLRQAISMAQGLKFKAAGGRGKIFREDPTTGKRLEIPVDVEAVVRGRRPDMAIMPNDVITVPNSRWKGAASVFLNGLGGAVRLPFMY